MIVNLLFSILACLVALVGIVLLVFLSCLIIRDIINDLKRWYKEDVISMILGTLFFIFACIFTLGAIMYLLLIILLIIKTFF